jgi:ferrous iron transport protein B
VQEICATVVSRPGSENRTVSDKLDAVLIHGVWGWVTLIVLMLGVFWTIFSVAEVPMGWIESAIGWIEGLVENAMQPGDLRDLLTGGVIEGVGGVLVFLPQIALLFFFIALLESSGYMARAAYLMDAVMAKAGLSGKAFLPLLSSYACAIPGVLATRTIPSKKERLVTIFVAPWMSCSARLPVYLLLVPLLLSEQSTLTQAVVFFGIYAVGTGTAFLVARVLRGRLGPEAQPVAFHLELPPYRAPQWGYVFRHVGGRAFAFLRKAGTLIFGLSILLWAAKTYPKSDSDDKAVQLETSAMGHLGQFIAPIVKPLGFDARTGTAVLTSFAAREVFVASMAISYSVDDEEDHAKIRERLATARWPDGSPVYTPLMAVSLIVFFIFALQCLPTTAVVAREAGSWKWAIGQFVFMTGFAYLASLVVYQGGRLLGF